MTKRLTPEQLVEALRLHQWDRWLEGDHIPAEAYLEQVPALQADATRAAELVYNEVFLRAKCGEAPQLQEYVARFPQLAGELRRIFEVHSVLESDVLRSQRPRSTVHSQPARKIAAVLAGQPDSHWPAIPGYEILAEVGRGGMGVVYQARQTKLDRPVALKMILSGSLAGEAEVARFRTEAEAIARLSHPNIVQIYEVGEAEGRPFFSLEYLEGGSLADQLDGTPWPAQRAAALIETLARAMHVAHGRGVIHRDLKPANVLLSADGTPKITDFGLAKRLDVPAGLTQSDAIVGTPSYMAPEQAGGKAKDVGPTADVYALGAVLYELQTGRPPFVAETPLETAMQVVSAEPVPPARLQPKVSRDLETICLKCLEKNPRRRYDSALALADDLRRFLEGKPIAARPVTPLGRTLKWARRRPAIAGLLVLVLAVTVTGIALVTWKWREAVLARQQTEAEKLETAKQRDIALDNEKATNEREAEMEAVLKFVEQRVFAAALPERRGGLGYDVTLHKAVEAAVPFLEKSLTNQPLIEARLRLTLGTAFRYLGDAKIAAEQEEAACALFARHRGPDHPHTLGCMNNLAISYSALGRHVDALKLNEETLALRKAKLGPDHADTLMSMTELANSYSAVGRYADALQLREQIRVLVKAKLGPNHSATLLSMHNLANSYNEAGRYTDALKLNEETLALRKAKLGRDHADTLMSMMGLANSYSAVGRHADALQLYEETLTLKKAKLGPNHPDTLLSMHNLANSYSAVGRHADTLQLREETLALMKAKLGPNHPHTLFSMGPLAESLLRLDRAAEAVPVIDECVQRAAGKVVDRRLLPRVLNLRLRHFEKIKDPAGCRQTAEMWEKLNRADANSLYDAACMRAVTAAVLKLTPGADATRLAKEEADRAIAWLKRAVAAGYKDAAHMKQDKDLDALRDREDFKKLLAELESRKAGEQKSKP
jgi:tetratricopeptide (TPR) repeat protein